jgi:colanic acid/amylovoran biosynthesis protein
MNPNPKVCLLGSSFGTNNFGVSVLTIGTVQCLLEASPKAEISLLDYGREPAAWTLNLHDHRVQLPLINIRFSKKLWQSNHIAYLILLALITKLFPFPGFRKTIIHGNRVLQHLEQMDFVTAISGGDSFSDIYGMERFIYIALPQILVLLLKKRLILLPQTLGPFRGRATRVITRFIFRGAERIYTRDKQSLAVAESLLDSPVAPGKLQFKHDVGFIVQPELPSNRQVIEHIDSWKKTGPLLGLNVSGLLFMGGYSRKNMFGLKTDYRQLTFALIDWFRLLNEGTLLLVPHTLGKEGTESDFEVCRALYKQFQPALRDRIQFIEVDLNERETKFIIGKCDFFSGARMHACIAALSQAVATVPIAYSDKFTGVMQTVGAAAQIADPRNMTQQEILDLVATSFKDRDAIRDRLRHRMPELSQSTLGLFADLFGPSTPGLNATQASFDREETQNSLMPDAKLRVGSGDSNPPKFPDAG